MRKISSAFTALLAIATIAVPGARASTYTPTFECIISGTSGCALLPTATNGPYTFPAPNAILGPLMNISFDGVTVGLYITSQEFPGDSYTWSTGFIQSQFQDTFDLTDVTTGVYGTWAGPSTPVFPTENGLLYFTASAPPSLVPEPGSLALLFTGMVGLLLVFRKRIARCLRGAY